MKEPVDHIERPSLPWRTGPVLTECGLPAAQVRLVTRTTFLLRVREWGQRRVALTHCMTCEQTARRWLDWSGDPRQAVEREIQWEGCGRYTNDPRGTLMRDELRAIALLIERYRVEFGDLVHAQQGTVDLASVRRRKERCRD